MPDSLNSASNMDADKTRKRPRPGERRLQILQVLAEMLQNPKGERVTTAALAARIQVSEAALYRHFASKAQMFEGLMTRVLLGDALLQEDDRLQERITQVLDRVEASLKQALRIAQTQGGAWAQVSQEEVSIRAAMLMSFVLGRWHRFARSGFKKLPTDASDISLRILLSE